MSVRHPLYLLYYQPNTLYLFHHFPFGTLVDDSHNSLSYPSQVINEKAENCNVSDRIPGIVMCCM